MKRQGRLFAIIITCMIALVLLAGLYPQTALADSYTSTTMRLLRFEGTVEIAPSWKTLGLAAVNP